jgi:hypothetical protein
MIPWMDCGKAAGDAVGNGDGSAGKAGSIAWGAVLYKPVNNRCMRCRQAVNKRPGARAHA